LETTKTVLSLMLVMITTLTTLTTTIAAVYAGGDNDDGNKQKAEDDSSSAIADCDDNEVEQAGFDCFGIAANDIDLDLGNGPRMVTTLTGADVEDSATEETETEETGIMSNPLFNLGQNSTG
jgi:hypothetical protein